MKLKRMKCDESLISFCMFSLSVHGKLRGGLIRFYFFPYQLKASCRKAPKMMSPALAIEICPFVDILPILRLRAVHGGADIYQIAKN
jgi:hypothetical protein